MENCSARYIEIFSDKTVTTMKSSALVVYLVHAVVLKLSIWFRRRLIWNGLTPIGFLLCSVAAMKREKNVERIYSEELSVNGFLSSMLIRLLDSVRRTSTCTACKERIIVLHEAMRQLLGSFLECGEQGFSLGKRS